QVAEASSAEELHTLEAYWIFTLQSHLPQFGYNLTFGGSAPTNNEETRKRKSESHKRRWANPETRARLLRNITPHTPESKARMVASLKQYYVDHPGELVKNRAIWKAAQNRPETQKKKSAIKRRYYEL